MFVADEIIRADVFVLMLMDILHAMYVTRVLGIFSLMHVKKSLNLSSA